ncbi:MAG: type II secretion system protein GspK [Deferrisomatales bacterium]|nr:type II secretion system protein GspK [Deferrisomatales bacterium]
MRVRQPLRRNGGAALLLVVLLVALLAVMVVEFQREARLSLQSAGNLRDTVQGHALARSGVAVAQVLLLEDMDDPERGSYDARGEDWNLEDFPVPVTSPDGSMGAIVERLEDLDGKFPLGALVNDEGIPQPRVVAAYERFLLALDQHLREVAQVEILHQVSIPDLVDAVVDWVDADADGEFEASPEFTVPNARILHLEDLQRVEGYGVVPEGQPRSVADVVAPYLDTRKSPAVNVNTAEPPVLVSLHPEITYDDAVLLYADLGEEPATTKFQPQNHSSVSGINLTQFDLDHTTASERFRLRLRVDVRGVVQQAEAVLERDRKGHRVRTVEWREGWLREPWRPAYGAPQGGFQLPGGLIP